jgi:hypothetical protein
MLVKTLPAWKPTMLTPYFEYKWQSFKTPFNALFESGKFEIKP